SRGPRSVAGQLGRLVLHESPGLGLRAGDAGRLDGDAGARALHVDRLMGSRGHADLGEPRRVDTDDVGGEDPWLDPLAQSEIEADDGVARLDAAQAAVAADRGGDAPVAAIAEVLITREAGWGGRRRCGRARRAGDHGAARPILPQERAG